MAIDEAGSTARVIVSSFDRSTLRAVRAADSRLALGLLVGVAADVTVALDEAVSAGFRAVHPFVASVDPSLVRRAHRAGLTVNVWTVNAPADLGAMVAAGVDVVITDRLAEALALVRGGAGHRPEWRGTAQVHQDGRP